MLTPSVFYFLILRLKSSYSSPLFIHNFLMLKMDENSTEVFIIFLNPVVQLFNIGLIEKAQHSFLQLTATFTGNNFHPVSYTHLRAHETRHDLVCRLLLE